ncbi:hypothetical protein FSP39_017789 [Pinctada imbricata]|uniref:DNA-directed DNA polymerase n=1 Tax=Pinctada imbricata TaxID=66713 RepID=A0AA89CB08_PINIB|nr:hypothetical protein FSP39_017789 [Pinctada imbricata]
MRRQKDDGEEEIAKPHFRSKMAIVLDHNKFEEHDLNEGMQKIFASFDEYIRRGSSWTLKKILKCEVYTVKYAPVGASRYFQLPNVLSNTRSIININNSDEKCFLWSILASLYPSDHNSHRVTHYVQYEDSLDMIGIDYPVHPTSVPRFENQNNISVNVFGYEESSCFPLYISKRTSSEYHVDLLYICKEDTSHWCLIKNFNRFMNHVVKKGGYVFCKYCLQGFTSQSVLVKHMEYCSKLDAQHITYPTKGKDDILTFTEWTKKLRVPFVIYADFETFCEPMSNCSPDDRKSFSTKVQKFEPCGFGYQVVSVDPRYTKAPVIYRGVDVAKNFLQELLQEQAEINDILQEIEPLTMTDSNEQDFQRSTQCHICTKTFTASSVKVRDHCHVSGRYRGAACQSCNLNFKHPQFIPVVFHNLKGFDGHILCQALGFFKDYEINCIAQNTEKYVSFSLGHLRFIDSYQFLGSSLGTLVEILASDGGLEHFHQLRDEFPNPNQSNLLLQKGVYCYEYVDSPEKFNRTTLPPIDSFYSHLTGETISDQDYEHARNVWSTMNMQNLGEYHDLYLKTDVLLLADVFEHFRDSILEYFHLDPCYFYTAPGLSWSAALRMTKCSLTLLTDPDMYLFFEQLRGGVSMISNKFAHANNPHVQDYDNSLPHTWIQYLDCNSLYAHTMTFPLPTGGFRWLSRDEVETLDITTIALDGEKGYVLEVDLEYPDHLHDDHSDLPVAPEHIEVSDDQLSPYSKRLLKKMYSGHSNEGLNQTIHRIKTRKLVPNLYGKSHYILHVRNLYQYIELGLVLSKIYRVIEFDQAPWIAPYIRFCAEKRRLSNSKAQSQFFKLLPNSFFGKTCEDLRKRINFKLVHNEKKFLKEVAKSSFKGFTIFSDDLVGMEHTKVRLHFNKPIYTGFCVLDISKTILYHFHYFEMKRKYPGTRLKLLWTDTDSLGYLIETDDLYADMSENLHLYDTSNFPSDHFLYSISNCRRPGVMKDEVPNKFIVSFVGLRAKMYSFICNDKDETKIAKGVQKSTIENHLCFEQYKACLFEESEQMCESYNIRSENHSLYMTHVNKIGLSALDDKRFVLPDKCNTLAIGHYLTRT